MNFMDKGNPAQLWRAYQCATCAAQDAKLFYECLDVHGRGVDRESFDVLQNWATSLQNALDTYAESRGW